MRQKARPDPRLCSSALLARNQAVGGSRAFKERVDDARQRSLVNQSAANTTNGAGATVNYPEPAFFNAMGDFPPPMDYGDVLKPGSDATSTTSVVNGRTYKEHPGAVPNPLFLVEVDTPVLKNEKGVSWCVELVKMKAGAPRTGGDAWYNGTYMTPESVVGMKIGTPVASGWGADGFYKSEETGNHAGIFAGPVLDNKGNAIGFTIVEQHRGAKLISRRDVYFDPRSMDKPDTYFYNANRYSTIRY